MTSFDEMLNGNVSFNETDSNNNAKFVKLNYTKNGTVVLTPTNKRDENISIGELEKFINF